MPKALEAAPQIIRDVYNATKKPHEELHRHPFAGAKKKDLNLHYVKIRQYAHIYAALVLRAKSVNQLRSRANSLELPQAFIALCRQQNNQYLAHAEYLESHCDIAPDSAKRKSIEAIEKNIDKLNTYPLIGFMIVRLGADSFGGNIIAKQVIELISQNLDHEPENTKTDGGTDPTKKIEVPQYWLAEEGKECFYDACKPYDSTEPESKSQIILGAKNCFEDLITVHNELLEEHYCKKNNNSPLFMLSLMAVLATMISAIVFKLFDPFALSSTLSVTSQL